MRGGVEFVGYGVRPGAHGGEFTFIKSHLRVESVAVTAHIKLPLGGDIAICVSELHDIIRRRGGFIHGDPIDTNVRASPSMAELWGIEVGETIRVLEFKVSGVYCDVNKPVTLFGTTFEGPIHGVTANTIEDVLIEQKIRGPGWLRVHYEDDSDVRIMHGVHTVVVRSPKYIAPMPDSDVESLHLPHRPTNLLVAQVSFGNGSFEHPTDVFFRQPWLEATHAKHLEHIAIESQKQFEQLLNQRMPDILMGTGVWQYIQQRKKMGGSEHDYIGIDTARIMSAFVDKSPRTYSVEDVREALGLAPRCALHILSDEWELFEYVGVLDITHKLACIAGCPWSLVCACNNVAQTDYMLAHTFRAENFAPALRSNVHGDDAASDTFTGGHVSTPACGLHTQGLYALLDFRSMYPSIIASHDCCIVTNGKHVLPNILKDLMERRGATKVALKTTSDTKTMSILNTTQLCLKLAANRIYGCLGTSRSRFHNQQVAQNITRIGREAHDGVIAHCTRLGLQVMMGDTDSVMIATTKTDIAEARAIAQVVEDAVNSDPSVVTGSMYLAFECVYDRVLIIGKKKYAARAYVDQQNCVAAAADVAGDKLPPAKITTRGMDHIRRDWCPAAKNGVKELVEHILQCKQSTTIEADECAQMIGVIINKTIEYINTTTNIDDLATTMSLTHEIESYKHPPPHVKAARGDTDHVYRAGDFVSFVWSKTTNTPIISRICHIDDVNRDECINRQFIPMLMRVGNAIGGYIKNAITTALPSPSNGKKRPCSQITATATTTTTNTHAPNLVITTTTDTSVATDTVLVDQLLDIDAIISGSNNQAAKILTTLYATTLSTDDIVVEIRRALTCPDERCGGMFDVNTTPMKCGQCGRILTSGAFVNIIIQTTRHFTPPDLTSITAIYALRALNLPGKLFFECIALLRSSMLS